jgi:hypothetical protein
VITKVPYMLGDLGIDLAGTTVPKRLREHAKFSTLLTAESVKIIKSNKTHRSWKTVVQYFAPGTAADIWLRKNGKSAAVGDLCPHKTRGCFGLEGENCIFSTGQLALPYAQLAMINRTLFYKAHPSEYLELLYHELQLWGRKAKEVKRKLALRLNGTSDIRWEKFFPQIFTDHPDITFYDYTKMHERLLPNVFGMPPPAMPRNYTLTFSRSEANDPQVEQVLKTRPDVNVAMVFETQPKIGTSAAKPLPPTAFGREVYDGDKHDLRFLDPRGVIVGLRAKGKLRREVKTHKSLFVIYDNEANARHLPRAVAGFDDAPGCVPPGYVQIGVVTGRDTLRGDL